MKKSILLLPLIFNIGIYSRELTKRIRIDHFNISYFNPNYMIVSYEIKKLDRKTNSVNMTLEVLQDITNLRGRLVVYKFVDNVYKETAIRYAGDICKFLDMVDKNYMVHINEKFDHLIKKCPVKKGLYYVRNFNGKDFGLAIFPPWKTKCEMEMEVDGKIIGTGYFLITVVEE